jgi:hypothetical protein
MFAKMTFVKAYKKWDQHLLLNHPRLWALRLPVLVSYFIAFNLISILVSSLVPLKTYHVNHMFTWLWIFGAVEVILLVLWIFRINRFSPEKSLERTSPLNGLWEVILYMLCALIFFSPTLSSSFVLEIRFAYMIPHEVLETDRAFIRDYSLNDRNSQDLVEKYSQIDYATYLDLDWTYNEGYTVNSKIDNTIHCLRSVTERNDDRWETYLNTAIVLLHFGVIIFNLRHIQRKVIGITILFVAGISIPLGYMLYLWIVLGISEIRSFYEVNIESLEITLKSFVVILIAFILFFSLRVFWQKRYRGLTAMTISLLPYLIFAAQHYLLFSLSDRYPVIDFLLYNKPLKQAFGSFLGDILQIFFLASPLMFIWVFIFTKAMYTRLLSLPEG